MRIGLIIHLIHTVAVRHDAREGLYPAVGRCCGLPWIQGHTHGGRVPGQRGGGGVGSQLLLGAKQVPLLVQVLWHVGIEDGEVLQPLQASEAVVQADGAAAAADAAVGSILTFGLGSGSHHLLLQAHRAFGPGIYTAERQHGFLLSLSPPPLPPPGWARNRSTTPAKHKRTNL